MSTTPAQPGLESLSKSFEPAALEAHWGPEWEKRGYGVAGFRGTAAPAADAPNPPGNFLCVARDPDAVWPRLAPHAIVEFVPKEDPMTRRLLAARRDIFDGYTIEGFRAAFGEAFEIVREARATEGPPT